MADITEQISPGDSIGRAPEVGMRDWTKRFTNVGGIGDITLGGEKEGADAIGVGGVTVGGVG